MFFIGFSLFTLVMCFVFAYLYFKNKAVFIQAVRSCSSDDVFDRPYYALKDEVGKEMLFSPFYAQNTACAIRQVQEVLKNPQLFPKSIKPEDVSLYYVFTLNAKSLFLGGFSFGEETPVPKKICNCSEDSLKCAYQFHKEVK